jgi:hypothetical protein
MKTGYELIEEVFGKDFDTDDLYAIRDNDLEGYELISDELVYNKGWYNYYEVIFKDLKTGKKYSFEYKQHTSDNVCDGGLLLETFKEVTEDKFQLAIDKLMDAVFDLGIELSEKEIEELTEKENKFLKALDFYCDVFEENNIQ